MADKYVYRNIGDTKLVIMGVGDVEPNAIMESEVLIKNPNLELLTKDDRKIGVDPVTKPTIKKK